MRIRALSVMAVSLAGLLSCGPEQTAETTTSSGPQPSSPSVSGNVFSRMFPALPPFASPTDATREQLNQLALDLIEVLR